MKHLGIRFTGLEYYFLARTLFLTLMNERYPKSSSPSPSSCGDSKEKQDEDAEAGEKSEAGEEEDAGVSFKDLQPTLDACRECYGVSAVYGNKALYLINGVLLQTPVSFVCVCV